jgi:hypothetical protein
MDNLLKKFYVGGNSGFGFGTFDTPQKSYDKVAQGLVKPNMQVI